MDEEYKQKIDYLMYAIGEVQKHVTKSFYGEPQELFETFEEWKRWIEPKKDGEKE